MTLFYNRQEAGEKLAARLKEEQRRQEGQWENILVLGIPRGGVEVAYPVAEALRAPLDVVIARKLGAPGNPELAMGAVAPDGSYLLNESLARQLRVKPEKIAELVKQETEEIKRRLRHYRGGRPFPELRGRTVIAVDDGLATGYTMEAALRYLRSQGVKNLVMAIPVAPPETLERLRPLVDHAECLLVPPLFYAVGQFYVSFGPTPEETVIKLLRKAGAGGAAESAAGAAAGADAEADAGTPEREKQGSRS